MKPRALTAIICGGSIPMAVGVMAENWSGDSWPKNSGLMPAEIQHSDVLQLGLQISALN